MLLLITRMAPLAAAFLAVLSLANDWPPTRFLRRLWDRYGSYVRWYVSSAPGTCAYVGVLAVTTWVLLGMPQELRERFIAAQSTNLQHLTSNPARVMVRSAFFVSQSELLVWGGLFLVFLAPAERWLGTARALAVFAMGHVIATLGAALDVWVHIRFFHGPASLWNVQDTGASYGFMALAGIMAYRLRGWNRGVLLAVLAGVVAYGAWEGTGFTARGHAIAVLVGLALYPMTRVPRVRERVHGGTGFAELCRRSTADGPALLDPAVAPVAAETARAGGGRRQSGAVQKNGQNG